MGRKGKKIILTEDLCGRICKYLAMGNYVEDCCKAVGISKSTFYNWKKLEKQQRGEQI